MKMLMLAALAVAATPALAQMAPAPGTPQSDPQSMPAPAPMPPASEPSMTPPAAPTTTTDSAPATPSMPMADSSAPASGGAYPMCSRTVTDHCTERSNKRGQRLHSTPRPR